MASVEIGNTLDLGTIQFNIQGSDPATPAANYGRLYVKAGGLYLKTSAGEVYLFGIADGTDLTDYGGAPDEAINFVGYDAVDNTPYRFRGDYMRLYRELRLTVANRNLPSISLLWVVFDSTTDREFSLDAGTIVNGHSIRAQCKQVSGGTGHSILLPPGVTWDGTNRRVILDSTSDRFEAIAESSTRFLIWQDTGCTYTAS